MRATCPWEQVSVLGHAHVVLARIAMRVVQQQPRADVGALPGAVQRVEERHRPDQVRRQPRQQQPALLEGLAHQPEVEHLQVAQPSVDQLAAARAGAGGQVALLDQPGRQPAGGRVQGGARPDDAAAHDQHVELAVGCAVAARTPQRRLASRRAERTGLGHASILPRRSGAATLAPTPGGPIRTYAGIGLVTSLTLAVTALGTPWSLVEGARRPVTSPRRSLGGFEPPGRSRRAASSTIGGASAPSRPARAGATATVVLNGDLLWHDTVWQSAAADHARTGQGRASTSTRCSPRCGR